MCEQDKTQLQRTRWFFFLLETFPLPAHSSLWKNKIRTGQGVLTEVIRNIPLLSSVSQDSKVQEYLMYDSSEVITTLSTCRENQPLKAEETENRKAKPRVFKHRWLKQRAVYFCSKRPRTRSTSKLYDIESWHERNPHFFLCDITVTSPIQSAVSHAASPSPLCSLLIRISSHA